MTSSVSFEDEWALLAPKLTHWLIRRGADLDTAADVCQDAALQSFRRHRVEPFRTRRDVRRFAWHVAFNRLTDIWRVRSRHEAPGPAPNLVAPGDVQEAVEHRLSIQETADALDKLPPYQRSAMLGEVKHGLPPNLTAAALASLPAGQRAALLAEVEQAEGRRAVNALAVARKKARKRLGEIVSGFPAVARWIRAWPWNDAPRVAATAGALLTLLLGLDALWTFRPVPPSVQSRPVAVAGSAVRPPMRVVEPEPHPSGPAPNASSKPTPRQPLAPAGQVDQVVVHQPTGRRFRTGFSPNSPDKPLVCVATALTPSLCIPKPVNLAG